MIVLKTFLRLLKRNLHVVLSYFAIFLIISILLVPKKPDNTASAKNSPVDVPIYFSISDLDRSPASESFIHFLEESFQRRDIKGGQDAIDDAIMIGSISAAITIHDNFTARIARGEEAVTYQIDPRSEGAHWLRSKIGVYLRMAYALVDDSGRLDLDSMQKILREQTDFVFPEKAPVWGGIPLWFEKYYLFLSFILLSIIMRLLTQLLMPFKVGKVKNRSLISGYSTLRYQGEQIVGLILTVLLIFGLFLAGSIVFGGLPTAERVPLFPQYVLNAIVFSLVSLSMSYLLIVLVPNADAANAMSSVLPLGLSFVSGVMVPQEMLGTVPLTIAKAFPFYYYVRVVENHADVLINLLIQLCFAAVYLLLALVISRAGKKESVNF